MIWAWTHPHLKLGRHREEGRQRQPLRAAGGAIRTRVTSRTLNTAPVMRGGVQGHRPEQGGIFRRRAAAHVDEASPTSARSMWRWCGPVDCDADATQEVHVVEAAPKATPPRRLRPVQHDPCAYIIYGNVWGEAPPEEAGLCCGSGARLAETS